MITNQILAKSRLFTEIIILNTFCLSSGKVRSCRVVLSRTSFSDMSENVIVGNCAKLAIFDYIRDDQCPMIRSDIVEQSEARLNYLYNSFRNEAVQSPTSSFDL